MEKPKYKSGAEKRKLKHENIEKISKLPKISQYFAPKQSPIEPQSSSSSLSNTKTDLQEQEALPSDTFKDECLDLHFGDTTIIPTDLGHYRHNKLSDDDRRLIISQPPNQPKGPFLKDAKQGNRSFTETHYSQVTQYGIVPRTWLSYSTILDAAYCVPCWLFSTSSNSWRTGIRDWKHISSRIAEHSITHVHLQSCSVFELWRKNQTVDKELEDKARYEVSFWKLVLERLFRVTLALAKNCLPFRGHLENIEYKNLNGNFLTMVELLSHYDDVMKQVLNMPSGSVRYLSKTTQNELIHCFSNFVLDKLVAEIKAANFFSLMLDTTQDIAKKDQLSVILRTSHIVRDQNGTAINFEIKESFLGFYEIKNQSAQGMTEAILDILKTLNIPINNCHGQGYDGANVMRGAYNGVQAKIREIQPHAEYVHCASHNLNLVVNDAVAGCKEVTSYFAVLQNIYSFFGVSIKRWDILASFSGESEITLKKLNPTRWSGRIQSITAVKIRFFDILKALTEIELKSTKKDEIMEASSLKKNMANFDFVIMTVFMFKTLNQINLASKTLQKTDIDLGEATSVLDRVYKYISNLRDPEEYNKIKSESIDLAKKWNIVPSFQIKRQPRVKRHFDELSLDYQFENREQYFKVKIYYFTIDIICHQIKDRFSGMLSVKESFEVLEPQNLLKSSTEAIREKCKKLSIKYPHLLSASFVNQFAMMYDLVKQEPGLDIPITVRQFFEIIIKKYAYLEGDFSEVYTAFLLSFSLPVTVASLERSFSKLKLLKNCLRSTTGEERLRNLAILTIEYKVASTLDITDLINRFANAKVRKRPF